jgi:hypothetical protein
LLEVCDSTLVGTPITIGLQASVLTYLPEYSAEEANWQLPFSLESLLKNFPKFCGNCVI